MKMISFEKLLALLAALCWQLFKPYKESQKLTIQ